MTISIDLIRERVQEFIYSTDNDCLAIKGKWGTGKTYLWNTILGESDANKMKIESYSYVSLFGMSSLQQIKMAVVSNMIGIKLINHNGTFIKSAKNFAKKNTNIISKLLRPFISGTEEIASLINDAYFFNLSNSLICFDDFERKDIKLTVQEILGIISSLKEQNNCKVVLIFNEDNLEDNEKNVYRQFREKVIDKEILFNPSSEDCAKLVFNEDTDSVLLSKFAKQLNINNIRILFHIKKLSKTLLDILHNYPDEVKYTALHSLVLFTYIFYANNLDFPDFYDLKEINYASFFSDKNDEVVQPRWKSIFQAYGYQNTDNFDLVIHDGVNHGFFDASKLLKEANLLADQVNINKSNEEIHKAWEHYRNGFNSDENSLIESLDKTTRKYYKNISPERLNSVITVLRTLNKNNLADELIDFYIKERSSENKLFNLSENFIIASKGFPVDQMLIDKFSAVHQSTIKRKSIKEVLECIATSSSWSEEDKKVYEAATADDLYKLFKSENSNNVYRLIKSGFFVIPKQTQEALKMIGNENPLNALKVIEFGIIINK